MITINGEGDVDEFGGNPSNSREDISLTVARGKVR